MRPKRLKHVYAVNKCHEKTLFYNLIHFINTNFDVLSGRFLSLEGVIKTFILLGGAFGGQVSIRTLAQKYTNADEVVSEPD